MLARECAVMGIQKDSKEICGIINAPIQKINTVVDREKVWLLDGGNATAII